MSRTTLLAAYIFTCIQLFAQPDKVALKYAERIAPSDLKSLLTVIASDSLEGRKTGTEGQRKAGLFISNYFTSIGLQKPIDGSHFQSVPLYSRAPAEAFIAIGNNKFENFKDIVYVGFENLDNEAEIIFIGDGSNLKDDLNLKGKGVLLSRQEAVDYELTERLKLRGASIVLLCNTETQNDFNSFADGVKKSLTARLRLAKPTSTSEMNRVVFLSPTSFKAITGRAIKEVATSTQAIRKTKIKYKLTSEIATVVSENVLGYLEGSDKKEEVVVITAHYDHIGKKDSGSGDLINNGADDDGSGTVAVMELAETFAQAKMNGNGPRRSILFMTVTGEEIGLFGSQYYTENPVYPLENTVVNLNIDMIGRSDPSHGDSADYVYVIGSDKLSSDLHQLSEQTNADCCNLNFDYLYNDVNHPSNLYKRSDHWNFAKNNIPIIFYFDGIHEDYHKPSDEIDKIDFELLAKRAKLIFYTAWEIANRNERPKVD